MVNFFVADVQTGFGPFVAVYLTTHKWTQIDIGFALTLGTMTSLISHRSGDLADGPELYKTFKDKKDGCTKVVFHLG